MPHRTLDVDGTPWRVMPSGHTTQSDADEFRSEEHTSELQSH